jgi:hypothetical protein
MSPAIRHVWTARRIRDSQDVIFRPEATWYPVRQDAHIRKGGLAAVSSCGCANNRAKAKKPRWQYRISILRSMTVCYVYLSGPGSVRIISMNRRRVIRIMRAGDDSGVLNLNARAWRIASLDVLS